MPPLGVLEGINEKPVAEPAVAVAAATAVAEAVGVDLGVLNSEDPTYSVHSNENEIGDVQKNLSDTGTIKAKDTIAYVMLLPSGLLQILMKQSPTKYELAMDTKGRARGKFKSLKETNKMIANEMKRRNPQHKPNTKNTKINDLVNELYSVHFEFTDEKDIKYVKYEERETRKVVHKVIDRAKNKSATNNRGQMSQSMIG